MTCGADLRCHISGEPDCSDAGVISEPQCFGHRLAQFGEICDPVSSTTMLLLDTDLDTRTADCLMHMQGDGREVCVLVADDIVVTGAVHVTGSRPLVLLAKHDLTIAASGSLDAGSRTTGNSAGAGHRTCVVNEGTTSSGGSGGGAGGGFGGAGGAGGNGYDTASGGAATAPLPVPDVLVGGCDGSPGGGGASNAGLGGGALYLIAGNVLQVDGKVNAGGGGGRTGVALQGGGGGGSGGMIVLEARVVNASNDVTAHGGGGTGGAGATGVTVPGADSIAAYIGAGAPGSAGTQGSTGMDTFGGKGGNGSTSTNPAGQIGENKTGLFAGAAGGGGGGGAGYILLESIENPSMTAGVISPAPI
jgi:hypothetical protein